MNTDDRVLWQLEQPDGTVVRCVMRSCCTGAELQLQRAEDILVRELYPDKATLYERASALHGELARG